MFDILEADIVIMQELKIQQKDLQDDMVLVPGWDVFFSFPKQKKGTCRVSAAREIVLTFFFPQGTQVSPYTRETQYARPSAQSMASPAIYARPSRRPATANSRETNR